MTYNSTQLIGKYFGHSSTNLGTNHLTTTEYHPQTNGQEESCSKTITTPVRHFIATHQRE